MALLVSRSLTKRFGGLTAVDELPLAVRDGEIRGLIGPNGSGKTTTINLISGLYRADGGEIHLRGERACDGDRIVHLRLAPFGQDCAVGDKREKDQQDEQQDEADSQTRPKTP